ncbi:MAG: patatin-like phospholipase family protein [Vicingaceae bacterium]
MRRLWLLLLITLNCYYGFSQKVGVVLSGGGAAGAAHVGVLKALEENEIPIDYIVGTSIGALVGGFYAAGYSPDQIEQIISSPEFRDAASGIVDQNKQYFLKRSADDPSILSLYFDLDSIFSTNLPTNFVSSLAIDYGLMEYFSQANAVAQQNFDSLFIPFRCLAANITDREQLILKQGNLATSVRASMTYPFYLSPVAIDGNIMFDGGLYNNFPADILCQEFEVDFIVASNVAAEKVDPTEDNLVSQIKSLLIRQSDFKINCAEGIIISTEVTDISTFDFYAVNKASERGYNTTISLMDSLKKQLSVTKPLEEVKHERKLFNAKKPALIYDSISFNGLQKNQAKYFKLGLKLDSQKVGNEELKQSFFRLASNESIRSIYPSSTYNPSLRAFDLNLKVKKEKKFKASFGGVIATKPFSTGFFGLDYQILNKADLKVSGNIYFGSFYNSAQGAIRWDIPFDLPFYIETKFTANSFDYFNGRATFIDDNNPPFIINTEQYWENKIGLPVFTSGKITMGASYLWQQYEYYQVNDFTRGDTSDLTEFEGLSAFIKYELNSLNRKLYASKGTKVDFSLRQTNGREKTTPGSTARLKEDAFERKNWLNLNFKIDKYFLERSKFHFGAYFEANYSDLPFFQNYTATLLLSPAFTPLVESRTIFQDQYRARTFFGAGLKAIYSIRDQLDFRLEAYVYQPYEQLIENADGSVELGEEVINRDLIGTFTTVYHTRLGPLAASVNFYDDARTELSFLVHFGYVLFNNKALE